MTNLPTVEIHHPADPAHKVVINKADFDPAVHKLWGELSKPAPTPEPSPAETSADALPAFVDAVNMATTARALTPIPGVGTKTAEGLLSNRPEGGYTSWNQMIEANADLNRVPWDELRTWEMD